MSKMKKTRKPGGGRKKLKPEYDAGKNLKEQMDAAVALYNSEMSLQAIADVLNLNPIKVRKLLITAGVYESNAAKKVKNTFEEYRKTQDYKTSILSTANTLKLSKASVTSYLPYKKGVYFPNTADKEKISVGAERQLRYRAVRKLRTEPTEEHLWEVVLLYAGVRFKTYSGLPFTYEIRKGRNGKYTKELWIDRRENLRPTRQNFKHRNSLSGMPLPLLVRKQSRMKIFKTSCRMNMTFSSKHNVDVTAICRRNGTSLYRSVPWGTVARENVRKDSLFRTPRRICSTRKTRC